MTATALRPRRARPRVPALRGLTWVAWRQHRLALAGVLVVLGGVGLFMLFNGLAMRHAYTSLGLNTCGKLDGPSCQSQVSIFQQDYSSWGDHLPHFLTFLPGLIGVFVGAPLVARELESGTFRFAWTQGRSRVQWIVTKLVLLGVALAALALAFSVLFTWWYGPLDAISGRMTPYGAYEVSGLVFAARTLFGFALGALLGLLIRRTVPAMAATGAAWMAVVLSSLIYLRPLIRTPITVVGALAKGPDSGSGNVPFNADVVSHWIQDAAGQHVDAQPALRPGNRRQRWQLAVPGAVPRLFDAASLQPMGLLPTERLVLALPDPRSLRLRHPRRAARRRHRAPSAPPDGLTQQE